MNNSAEDGPHEPFAWWILSVAERKLVLNSDKYNSIRYTSFWSFFNCK